MKRSVCLFLNSVVLVVFLVMSQTGCQSGPIPTWRLQQGLVYMFPGIEGGYWSLSEARRGLRDGQVESALYTHEWQHPFLPLSNLMDYEANRVSARQAAAEIVAYHQKYPAAPIDLLGYSGGGGLALMVAEELPDDFRLRNVILVHPAVSPDYSLDAALSHVNGRLINFYSSWDWLVLGLGTSVFGTIDRKHVASAGNVGFDLEQAVRQETLRNRVVQQRWSLASLGHGHLGGHLTIAFYQWNRDVVAPYLLRVSTDEN